MQLIVQVKDCEKDVILRLLISSSLFGRPSSPSVPPRGNSRTHPMFSTILPFAVVLVEGWEEEAATARLEDDAAAAAAAAANALAFMTGVFIIRDLTSAIVMQY